MTLVINIPEHYQYRICSLHFVPEELVFDIGEAIAKGTPLPKEQGSLEDLFSYIYNLGYRDGEHDGYCASTIEGGMEEAYYGRGLKEIERMANNE